MEQLNRVTAENKQLAEMLRVMCNSYTVLKNQSTEYTAMGKKRKAEIRNNIANKNGDYFDGNNIIRNGAGVSECVSDNKDSSKKPREELAIKSKVLQFRNVLTDASNTSVKKYAGCKDGYRWRKYGQKVMRDNRSPRTYFRCFFAPTWPVKKKVQRSIGDPLIVVASYEGEHNHPPTSKPKANSSLNQSFFAPGTLPSSTPPSSSRPTIMIKPES